MSEDLEVYLSQSDATTTRVTAIESDLLEAFEVVAAEFESIRSDSFGRYGYPRFEASLHERLTDVEFRVEDVARRVFQQGG